MVKTFASAVEFLAQPDLDVPGCVLVDLRMPGLSGLELQDVMARAGHLLPVIFLSGHGDVPTTVRAMRQGAEDFLTKTAPKEDLIAAVKRAVARDASERADRARQKALRAPFAALTRREVEVLQHVVQGKLNKQIALGYDFIQKIPCKIFNAFELLWRIKLRVEQRRHFGLLEMRLLDLAVFAQPMCNLVFGQAFHVRIVLLIILHQGGHFCFLSILLASQPAFIP